MKYKITLLIIGDKVVNIKSRFIKGIITHMAVIPSTYNYYPLVHLNNRPSPSGLCISFKIML